MTRNLTVGAAQLGPIARTDTRDEVVARLLALLEEAAGAGVELVVYPELALTTFFPRWYLEDPEEIRSYYETEMPGPATQPLFSRARELGVGFCLGYAELTTDANGTVHQYNSQVLVERDGSPVATFRKVHIPGHEANEAWRPFQHLERRYFEPGPDGFGVWRAFGGLVGMMICNDRRWPETYRVMGLQGVEMILCGYNTPMHYAPDPPLPGPLGYHNPGFLRGGPTPTATGGGGGPRGGVEEGVDSLCQSAVIAPSGEIVAQAATTGDELVVATCDLDWCHNYKGTLFDFDHYRMPQHYGRITAQKGAVLPPALSEVERGGAGGRLEEVSPS